MDIYEKVKVIGEGNYGQVYLANHKLENKLNAVKKFNFKEIDEKGQITIANEVKLMQDLIHPNIVSFKDYFRDSDSCNHLVMSYCDEGDVFCLIKQKKTFKEEQIIDWIINIGLALLYIHDKKILHRDMKTQNLFLHKNRVLIGDFGIAKIFNNTKELAGSVFS